MIGAFFPQRLGGGEAVHPRHAGIHEDQVEAALGAAGEGVFAVGGEGDVPGAEVFEHPGDHGAVDGVVFGHQDARALAQDRLRCAGAAGDGLVGARLEPDGEPEARADAFSESTPISPSIRSHSMRQMDRPRGWCRRSGG